LPDHNETFIVIQNVPEESDKNLPDCASEYDANKFEQKFV